MIVRASISSTDWKLNNNRLLTEHEFKVYKTYLTLTPSKALIAPSTTTILWDALKLEVIITCVAFPITLLLFPILDSKTLDEGSVFYILLHALAFGLALLMFFGVLGVLRTVFNYLFFVLEYKNYVSSLTKEIRAANSYEDYTVSFRNKNKVGKEVGLIEAEKERELHSKYMPPS